MLVDRRRGSGGARAGIRGFRSNRWSSDRARRRPQWAPWARSWAERTTDDRGPARARDRVSCARVDTPAPERSPRAPAVSEFGGMDVRRRCSDGPDPQSAGIIRSAAPPCRARTGSRGPAWEMPQAPPWRRRARRRLPGRGAGPGSRLRGVEGDRRGDGGVRRRRGVPRSGGPPELARRPRRRPAAPFGGRRDRRDLRHAERAWAEPAIGWIGGGPTERPADIDPEPWRNRADRPLDVGSRSRSGQPPSSPRPTCRAAAASTRLRVRGSRRSIRSR